MIIETNPTQSKELLKEIKNIFSQPKIFEMYKISTVYTYENDGQYITVRFTAKRSYSYDMRITLSVTGCEFFQLKIVDITCIDVSYYTIMRINETVEYINENLLKGGE